MFESIYNTEALLLAVKLNQRFHREREKFPSASPPLPNAPWHPGARAACGAMQGHGAGCGGKPFGHGKKKTAVSTQTKRPHRAEGLAAAPWRRRPRGLRNERAGQHSAQLDASPNHSQPLPATRRAFRFKFPGSPRSSISVKLFAFVHVCVCVCVCVCVIK